MKLESNSNLNASIQLLTSLYVASVSLVKLQLVGFHEVWVNRPKTEKQRVNMGIKCTFKKY